MPDFLCLIYASTFLDALALGMANGHAVAHWFGYMRINADVKISCTFFTYKYLLKMGQPGSVFNSDKISSLDLFIPRNWKIRGQNHNFWVENGVSYSLSFQTLFRAFFKTFLKLLLILGMPYTSKKDEFSERFRRGGSKTIQKFILQIFAIIDDTSVMNFVKHLQYDFPKMRGGSKVVWNFSENSSVLDV